MEIFFIAAVNCNLLWSSDRAKYKDLLPDAGNLYILACNWFLQQSTFQLPRNFDVLVRVIKVVVVQFVEELREQPQVLLSLK